MDDLCNNLLKNMISSALHSAELVARAKSLHYKAKSDDAVIDGLRTKEKRLEKENQDFRKRLEAAEERAKTAEEKAEASEQKTNAALKHLASKDEELLQKIEELGKTRAQLSSSRKEEERLSKKVHESYKELNEAKEANIKLKIDLRTYMSAALEIEKVLKAKETKAAEDLEAQFDDFVSQMEDARNEYFLDGWEAAMSKLGIDPASETYRNVPFPVPDRLIPKFGYERDPRSPPIEVAGEELQEGRQIEQPVEEPAAPSPSIQELTVPEEQKIEQPVEDPIILSPPLPEQAVSEVPPMKDAADLVTEVAKSIADEISKDEAKGEDS